MKPFRFEINIKNKKSLLTFPDEEILIAKRQHWFILATSLFITVVVGLIFILLSILSFWIILRDGLLLVLSLLTVIIITSSVVIKKIMNWYFHAYIVTNHKIMEFDCKPFFSEGISDILLDLVRCTEIDTHTNGIINQLLNKGDIYITFDRPTHSEGFVVKDIYEPRLTGELLNQVLIAELSNHESSNATWIKRKDAKKGKYQYIEDLIPQKGKAWS